MNKKREKHGFVLVSPKNEILAETFRPTRDAAKGWLIMLEVNGRYERWDWFYRHGWRCKPAELTILQPTAPAGEVGKAGRGCLGAAADR